MKKLVELDPISMATKEFDLIKIKRSARSLKEYLMQLGHEGDVYRIRERVLPIVEQAITGTLVLPFDNRKQPLLYEYTEGLLPREYSRFAAPFFVSIAGLSGLGSSLLEPIHKDGKIYAWMEFEE